MQSFLIPAQADLTSNHCNLIQNQEKIKEIKTKSSTDSGASAIKSPITPESALLLAVQRCVIPNRGADHEIRSKSGRNQAQIRPKIRVYPSAHQHRQHGNHTCQHGNDPTRRGPLSHYVHQPSHGNKKIVITSVSACLVAPSITAVCCTVHTRERILPPVSRARAVSRGVAARPHTRHTYTRGV